MRNAISHLRAATAAAVLALAFTGAAKAQTDPFGGFRYDPWAVYSSNFAVQFGQQLLSTENAGDNAQAAYNYAVVTRQYLQYIYYSLYQAYATGATTRSNYAQYVQTAFDFADQANQFAYQAYLEQPTPLSQAFSGWCYYTFIYTQGLRSQGAPPQNFVATVSQKVGYYVRARLYASNLSFAQSFLTHDPQLDLAAQHHAQYMATNDAVSNDENGVTTNTIITQNSTYSLDTSVQVTVLNTQASNIAFLGAQFGALVNLVNPNVTDLGVGVATSASGKVYYTIYVAKSN